MIGQVLVISPIFPQPNNSGVTNRLRSILWNLKQAGATVHLLFFLVEDYWKTRFDHLSAVESHYYDFLHVAVAERARRGPANKRFFHIDEWWDHGLERYMRWLSATIHFDACVVNYVFLSKAFDFVAPKTCKILDTHDIFTDRDKRLGQLGLQPEFFWTSSKEELRGFARADVVLAISSEDLVHLQDAAPQSALYLPYSPPEIREDGGFSDPHLEPGRFRFGFAGSPSQLNQCMLLDFVFSPPIVKLFRDLPRAELHIPNALAKFITAPTPSFVVNFGEVEDITSFYRAMDAVLIPGHYGTGQQTKLAEAFAMGVPVIANRAAAKLATELIDPAHQCEDTASMAVQMRSVVDQPSRRIELARASTTMAKRIREQARAGFAELLTRVGMKSGRSALILINSRTAGQDLALRVLESISSSFYRYCALHCVWVGSRESFFSHAGHLRSRFSTLRIYPSSEGIPNVSSMDFIFRFGKTEVEDVETQFVLHALPFIEVEFGHRKAAPALSQAWSSALRDALFNPTTLRMPVGAKALWIIAEPEHHQLIRRINAFWPQLPTKVFSHSPATPGQHGEINLTELSQLNMVWSRNWWRPWIILDLADNCDNDTRLLSALAVANSIPIWRPFEQPAILPPTLASTYRILRALGQVSNFSDWIRIVKFLAPAAVR